MRLSPIQVRFFELLAISRIDSGANELIYCNLE